MQKKYDVCGIGTPVVDILINAKDHHLKDLKIRKGATNLINERKADYLMDYFKDQDIKIACGGDCPNTMLSIASLGGKAVYSGNIGLDKYGRIFEEELLKEGILCNLNRKKGKTSSCFILVTPDSERSMNILLSKCENNKFQINKKHIINSKYIYITGHMFDYKHQINTVIESMKIAKRNNVRVAFDLGDPISVKNNRNLFYKIVKRYVNVLFANEEEAELFTNESDYTKALNKIFKLVDVAVIKLGSRGSIIKYKNKIIRVKPFEVNAIDTTGAGDMYAAGFLFGLSHGYSLERSGRIASYLAAKVVEKVGARLDYSLKNEIENL